MYISNFRIEYNGRIKDEVLFDFDSRISLIVAVDNTTQNEISHIFKQNLICHPLLGIKKKQQIRNCELEPCKISYNIYSTKNFTDKPLFIRKLSSAGVCSNYINNQKVDSLFLRGDSHLLNHGVLVDCDFLSSFIHNLDFREKIVDNMLLPAEERQKKDKNEQERESISLEIRVIDECLNHLNEEENTLLGTIDSLKRRSDSLNDEANKESYPLNELRELNTQYLQKLHNLKEGELGIISAIEKKNNRISELLLFCNNQENYLRDKEREIGNFKLIKREKVVELSSIRDKINELNHTRELMDESARNLVANLERTEKGIDEGNERIKDLNRLLCERRRAILDDKRREFDKIRKKEKMAAIKDQNENFLNFLQNERIKRSKRIYLCDVQNERYIIDLISNYTGGTLAEMEFERARIIARTLTRKRGELKREIERVIQVKPQIQTLFDDMEYASSMTPKNFVAQLDKRGEIHSINNNREEVSLLIMKRLDIPHPYITAVKAYLNHALSYLQIDLIMKILGVKKEIRTFDNLPHVKINRGLISGSGVIGYLFDIVSFDNNIRDLMHYIFSETLLVESRDNALFYREFLDCVIVSIDGSVTSKREIQNQRDAEPNLGVRQGVLNYPRKNEYLDDKESESEIEKIPFQGEAKLQKAMDFIDNVVSLEMQSGALLDEEKKYSELQMQQHGEVEKVKRHVLLLDTERGHEEKMAKIFIDDLNNLNSKIIDIEHSNENMSREINELDGDMSWTSISFDKIQEEIKDIEANISKLARDNNELVKSKIHIMERIASSKSEISSIKREISKMEGLSSLFACELDSIERSVVERERAYLETQTHLLELKMSLSYEKRELSEIETQLAEIKKERCEVENKIAHKEREQRQSSFFMLRKMVESIFNSHESSQKSTREETELIIDKIEKIVKRKLELESIKNILTKNLEVTISGIDSLNEVLKLQKNRLLSKLNMEFGRFLSRLDFVNSEFFKDTFIQNEKIEKKSPDTHSDIYAIALLYFAYLHSYTLKSPIIFDNVDNLFTARDGEIFCKVIEEISLFSQAIVLTVNKRILKRSSKPFAINLANGHIQLSNVISMNKSARKAA